MNNSRIMFVANSHMDDRFEPTAKKGHAKVMEILREVAVLERRGWARFVSYDEKGYWKIICVKDGCPDKAFSFDKGDFKFVVRQPEDAEKLNNMFMDLMEQGEKIIDELVRVSAE